MARADPAGPPRKVHGPRVPGAETRPMVGRIPRLVDPKPKKKRLPPPKDEVERSERYMKGNEGTGGLTSQALKQRKLEKLKQLIEPLTPSLIQVMSDIAHDKKVHAAVRLDAADRLLNRLYGKPTERVELSDPTEDSQDVDEVRTLLNRILESVGAPLLEFHDQVDPVAPSEDRTAPPAPSEEGPGTEIEQ